MSSTTTTTMPPTPTPSTAYSALFTAGLLNASSHVPRGASPTMAPSVLTPTRPRPRRRSSASSTQASLLKSSPVTTAAVSVRGRARKNSVAGMNATAAISQVFTMTPEMSSSYRNTHHAATPTSRSRAPSASSMSSFTPSCYPSPSPMFSPMDEDIPPSPLTLSSARSDALAALEGRQARADSLTLAEWPLTRYEEPLHPPSAFSLDSSPSLLDKLRMPPPPPRQPPPPAPQLARAEFKLGPAPPGKRRTLK